MYFKTYHNEANCITRQFHCPNGWTTGHLLTFLNCQNIIRLYATASNFIHTKKAPIPEGNFESYIMYENIRLHTDSRYRDSIYNNVEWAGNVRRHSVKCQLPGARMPCAQMHFDCPVHKSAIVASIYRLVNKTFPPRNPRILLPPPPAANKWTNIRNGFQVSCWRGRAGETKTGHI